MTEQIPDKALVELDTFEAAPGLREEPEHADVVARIAEYEERYKKLALGVHVH